MENHTREMFLENTERTKRNPANKDEREKWLVLESWEKDKKNFQISSSLIKLRAVKYI